MTQTLSSSTTAAGGALAERYPRVRQFTTHLCDGLATEDYVIQSMPDVSPTKWHLAHTTWFFETFVLVPNVRGYKPFHPQYAYLFNSYYVQAGPRHCRPKRGLLSRPTVEEVYAYRRHVDEQMEALLKTEPSLTAEVRGVIEIGIHHEQQHQELMLTDIKHVFWMNPLKPVYRPGAAPVTGEQTAEMRWVGFDEGVYWIGHDGNGFAYDNESARHREFVDAFELASRLVTCGEYRQFIEDGGYERPELWLSEGWNAVQSGGWTSPLYWEKRDGQWRLFTLGGERELHDAEPVCHVSYYEADAFARWAGHRLPTEAEWEVASDTVPIEGTFAEGGAFHPRPARRGEDNLAQMFGEAWQWTRSAYLPYPGYRPLEGALGEYNGKFMSNQFVLRGGSGATSITHIRRTYRNFFPPDARWQLAGIRLAR